MSSNMGVKVTAPASEPLTADEHAALHKGLNGYNERFTGPLLSVVITSVLKNEAGVTLGAIVGEINWGWLYVKALWVDEGLRYRGWGTQLLQGLEAYACAKGIIGIRLETSSFQALGFYRKQGYVIFAELGDMPPGETCFFLKKYSAEQA